MLVFKAQSDLKTYRLGDPERVQFTFLENGTVFSIVHKDILINQLLGSPVEAGLGNLYVRLRQGSGIQPIALMGPESGSAFYPEENRFVWKGQAQGLAYSLSLQVDERLPIWFWTVRVENQSNCSWRGDAVLAQDLGLAFAGAVRLNEAYISQYIDHAVLKNKTMGYMIGSRQNQRQGDGVPWILHGCLDGSRGYLTDGFQFYGLRYKATQRPEALFQADFPNTVMQYECALAGLQSLGFTLSPGQAKEIRFFAYFQPNHPLATGSADLGIVRSVQAAAHRTLASRTGLFPASRPVSAPAGVFDHPRLFQAVDLTPKDIKRYFPGAKRHVEKVGNQWQSFFYQHHYYIALKAKELRMERPHGHILRSGTDALPNDDTLSYTVYMNGVFNSQLTVGNTSMNRILSVARNPLNVTKSSGQRIFIKTAEGYELLGMPSAFEVGLHHARWIYKGKKETVVVTTWASLADPVCFLEVEVEGGKQREWLLTHQVVMDNNEYDAHGRILPDPGRGRITLIPDQHTRLARSYPQARFYMMMPDQKQVEKIEGDSLLYDDGQERGLPFVTVKIRPSRRLRWAFTGSILKTKDADAHVRKYSRGQERFSVHLEQSRQWLATFSRGLALQSNRPSRELEKMNDIVPWYLHNALIHCTVPRGLEQYTGAAWGLRDVCQGPVEMLIAFRHYAHVKSILKTVYQHQYVHSGDWPQWFMFDRFFDIQSPESHGDIIIWPIKALCDYIEATNDVSILKEKVGYTRDKKFTFTASRESIFAHTLRQIKKIERDFIPGTALVSFGHGDWEDTLQPAHPEMRKHLISSWTVELVYQSLTRYARVCEKAGQGAWAKKLKTLTLRMRKDFNAILMPGGVVAGLAYVRNPKRREYILHPQDRKTGVHYRLLPMTRGMIAEIFTPEQMKRHREIIRRALLFPDGVRLMEKPLQYLGGLEKHFRRAESASNFGREIGLMYVHAHIRYMEALAKIGDAEALFQAIFMINPIGLEHVIPSAQPRQSNAYFSSSDAAFLDRYQARRQFGKIHQGRIGIKGGWRIYSSGPGIYLHQILYQVLGIREQFEDVVFDPVLPKALNGLQLDMEYQGKKVRFCYRLQHRSFSPQAITVNGKRIPAERYTANAYRRGGMLMPRAALMRLLNRKHNVVEIHL